MNCDKWRWNGWAFNEKLFEQQENKWATDQLNKYDMYTQADFNSRFSI